MKNRWTGVLVFAALPAAVWFAAKPSVVDGPVTYSVFSTPLDAEEAYSRCFPSRPRASF